MMSLFGVEVDAEGETVGRERTRARRENLKESKQERGGGGGGGEKAGRVAGYRTHISSRSGSKNSRPFAMSMKYHKIYTTSMKQEFVLWIVARIYNRTLYLGSNTNRESVTICETINGDDYVFYEC